ncbi:ribosomal protein S5 domain 2-like protein [Exidia glandulosa HHB12029]|uniref:Small ribosomal subunit protein uS5m n=1 Tax=Exidia glandulosa HHB12029 TaxID=1314781 RepID=A0A166AWT2_EXIGL|nr:ribosomal protein S5 domain 2-like protein [Exidia glandulosa HHB12029]
MRKSEFKPVDFIPYTPGYVYSLMTFPLLLRRTVQQTGKGKINNNYTLVVVGNGNGLVGIGEGKDMESFMRSREKAIADAVRNMDYVERFEDRTIWTEIDDKLGATRIILRPRPVGFGLACNPYIHQILKAAGIKDISAKVWGSRNPLNVIKTVTRMLHAGHMPVQFGSGTTTRGGRRMEGKTGVRGKQAVERERGRKLVSGRAW